MTIKEICIASGLTKKAIAYYEQKGLIHPGVQENGYREYGLEDLSLLRQIACLRLYGLTVPQIGQILQSEDKAAAIAALLPQQQEKLQQQKKRLESLCRLAETYDLTKAEQERKTLEADQTIQQKLRMAFPGGYGDYMCFHFGRYLGEPLDTPEKEEAYAKILSFLDDLCLDGIDPELERYLTQTMEEMPKQAWKGMDASVQEAVVDPEGYLKKHGENLRDYLRFTQTNAFQDSPAAKMKVLLQQLMDNSGYYTVFLPNLRVISKSYRDYSDQLERANDLFLQWMEEHGVSGGKTGEGESV